MHGGRTRKLARFIECTPPREAVGVAGIIEDVGREIDKAFHRPGDEVLAYLSPQQEHTGTGRSTSTPSSGMSVAVEDGMFCKKPQSISFEVAARLPMAFVTAAAVSSEYFQVHHNTRRAEQSNAEAAATTEEATTTTTDPVATVLVTGGETPTGAMMIWLLHRTHPKLVILSTCSAAGVLDPNDFVAGDDESLISRVRHLCSIGAMYAIDANATDLLEHFQAASTNLSGGSGAEGDGIEVIVDVVGLVARRPELMSLLGTVAGRKTLVDCTSRDIEADRLQLLDDDQGMNLTRALGDIVHDMMSGNLFETM